MLRLALAPRAEEVTRPAKGRQRSDLTTDPQVQFPRTKWILTCAFAHARPAKVEPLRSNPNGVV